MDEYLTGVREIEQRLARTEKAPDATKGVPAGYKPPTGMPKDRKEHLRLMADMLVLAFQGDLTRIATYVFANDGSNRPYREIDVPEGHHDLSHHGRKKEKQAKIQKINLFHIEQLAYLIGKLAAVKEGEKSLLDNCMIAYGSGNSDGNRHNHDDLPILMLGKGGGSLEPGRHLKFPRNTPVNNLWISMLAKMGVNVDKARRQHRTPQRAGRLRGREKMWRQTGRSASPFSQPLRTIVPSRPPVPWATKIVSSTIFSESGGCGC